MFISAAPAPPPPVENESPKTAEELAFDEQFRKWEEEFDNWKRKNANHPDKSAYREYEKKFEECRKKLVERREHLRKKRLAEAAATAAAAAATAATTVSNTGVQQYPQQQQQSQFSQPPPPPPPEEETGMDVGLFKNALGGATTSGGGIPGLDLINETGAMIPQMTKNEDVVEVIDLEDEREEKPDVNQLNESIKQTSNPVNALASLLKDPKVSALLNIISGNNNGQGVNLSCLGNSDLLQQIQNAAGAVINANQNGSLALGSASQSQNQFHGSGQQTPISDDRSRASFHDDRRSIVSGDERSRDIDDAIRGPPPMRGNDHLHRGPPPNQTKAYNFDLSVPPPVMNVDLSRPPPLFNSNPTSRPLRSEQPSPTSSNTSSTSRQRQSRWSNHHQSLKQDFEPETAIKDEPFNGSSFLPDGDSSCYVGHQDELQIDPELGTPCAVPKPDWMEEEEYQEIYDRYEDIEVFEERKYKMELAIRLLEKKKKEVGLVNKPAAVAFGTGTESTSGRWLGGMPTPLKQEPAVGVPPKRPNPFAADDDFFRPKQVIDYSNGSPRVIDYGHSSGPVAGKFGSASDRSDQDSRKSHDRRDLDSNDRRGMGSHDRRDMDSNDRRDTRFRDGQRFNEQRGERGSRFGFVKDSNRRAGRGSFGKRKFTNRKS